MLMSGGRAFQADEQGQRPGQVWKEACVTGKSGRRRVEARSQRPLCWLLSFFSPLPTLHSSLLPGKLFMAQSTSSLDLWLPVRFGQWEAPARTQRAAVFY